MHAGPKIRMKDASFHLIITHFGTLVEIIADCYLWVIFYAVNSSLKDKMINELERPLKEENMV